MVDMNYQSIKVRIDGRIAYIQIYRPEHNNTINDALVMEFHQALNALENDASVVVIEGLPEVFCFGANFNVSVRHGQQGQHEGEAAEMLYDLWLKIAQGKFISIAHVKGKANAGGLGFVAACDVVIADESAHFSLSELLFGLLPACVLPFLVRRIGFQRANYLSLHTQAINCQQAAEWGLVDAYAKDSRVLLRKHLLRFSRMSKPAIVRYKKYIHHMDPSLANSRPQAIKANREVFSDANNLAAIERYVREGVFPWEN